MDNYKIESAYGNKYSEKFNEIEIISENLLYAELQDSHSGCQTSNLKNNDLIHKKCREISKLIKEIDALNKN